MKKYLLLLSIRDLKEKEPQIEKKGTFLVNKYFHEGTFGTFIRFLPMFEKNKYKLIWSSDVDQYEIQFLNTKKRLEEFEKTDAKFWVYTYNCYLTNRSV